MSPTLRDAWPPGDAAAAAAVERAGRALGVALASTLNAVAMHRVVLAGNFAVLAEQVARRSRRNCSAGSCWRPWSPPEVEVALVEDHPAPSTGAALTALAGLVADPAA